MITYICICSVYIYIYIYIRACYNTNTYNDTSTMQYKASVQYMSTSASGFSCLSPADNSGTILTNIMHLQSPPTLEIDSVWGKTYVPQCGQSAPPSLPCSNHRLALCLLVLRPAKPHVAHMPKTPICLSSRCIPRGPPFLILRVGSYF